MAQRGEPKLTDEARTFVVQSLACFDAPSIVAAALRKEFDQQITPQSVEGYDPTKRAGRNLAAKWKALFDATRTAFLADTAQIGVANKAVRLRAIGRIAAAAEARGNVAVALQALEQAAKEVGEAFTNRREISGPKGAPIEVHTLRDGLSKLSQEARDQIRKAITGGVDNGR